MRKRMIAGNWKMNKVFSEAVELATGLAKELEGGTGDVDVVVAPPTIDLKGVAEVIEQEQAPFALSAQNVYWQEAGAYTGETAPNMLEAIGATHCIIGHSERRDYFGETDEDINKKAKALMAHGIVPISCCGESLEIREAGTHVEFVVDQIKKDTAGLEITDPAKYVIAYEPIWAIGTGKTATADDAQEVCGAIRKTLVEIFGEETASCTAAPPTPATSLASWRRKTSTALSSAALPSRLTASLIWCAAPWRKLHSFREEGGTRASARVPFYVIGLIAYNHSKGFHGRSSSQRVALPCAKLSRMVWCRHLPADGLGRALDRHLAYGLPAVRVRHHGRLVLHCAWHHERYHTGGRRCVC